MRQAHIVLEDIAVASFFAKELPCLRSQTAAKDTK
jgi:hypothetical protein